MQLSENIRSWRKSTQPVVRSGLYELDIKTMEAKISQLSPPVKRNHASFITPSRDEID